MLVLLAPPLPGGSGTFSVATWNIMSARRAGLAPPAKGLRQMGVGCAVLTKTKLTDARYPKHVEGYHVIALKTKVHSRGGFLCFGQQDIRTLRLRQ
jgi:hypothetical protein